MLFFEFGYVFDTLDNTKQRVTEGYLVKALKNTGCEFEY